MPSFDTIDLELMRIAFEETVPPSMQQWAALLFSQWSTMDRWICYDGCTHGQPITTSTGLPQGDPASPLVMNVLMLCCYEKIKSLCNNPNILHVCYMDDRTAIAPDAASISQVVRAWNEVAAEYHLMENVDKTQIADLSKADSMEVLGALVGQPNPTKVKNSKASKRISESATKFRRIGFLPLRHREKLRTANLFGRSGLEYGWISSRPTTNQCKAQEIWLWKTLGRARYVSPYMRKVVIGAHSFLPITLLCRQIRLIAKRNEALRSLHLQVGRAPLDCFVEEGLEKLGWLLDGDRWHHPCYGSFVIDHLTEDKLWREVHHNIRESYREIAYCQLMHCGRHDAQEINVEYSSERRKLALKWAGANFLSFMIVAGGLQSPLQRAILGYNTSLVCPKCGERAPGWDHLWQCAVGFLPSDGLMRRYLWPRSRSDFALCSAYLKAFLSTGC